MVVVGGGVIGCSVAYHLTRLGWRDVLLLERDRLTSGTTWHAAGLITSAGMADETSLWMSRYSRDLYARLEEETGHSTGFRPIGHISVASTPQRLEALRREAAFARGFGVADQRSSPPRWPSCGRSRAPTTCWPASSSRTRAAPTRSASPCRWPRARERTGARIVEGVLGSPTCEVSATARVTGVVTDRGAVEAENVVNAGGMWARQLGAVAGVTVPLQAAEHYYLLTEPFEGVHRDLPVIEDPDRTATTARRAAACSSGCSSRSAAPWQLDGIPHDSSFAELPPDWDRVGAVPRAGDGPHPVAGRRRDPARSSAGRSRFTADIHPMLGPAPELDGYFVAAGLNSLGILLGGGVGSVMAQWIVDGVPPVDVAAYAVERAPCRTR